MENISEYIDLLVQAPLAVILVIHIFYIHRLLINTNNKLIDTVQQLAKIIKQQERFDKPNKT